MIPDSFAANTLGNTAQVYTVFPTFNNHFISRCHAPAGEEAYTSLLCYLCLCMTRRHIVTSRLWKKTEAFYCLLPFQHQAWSPYITTLAASLGESSPNAIRSDCKLASGPIILSLLRSRWFYLKRYCQDRQAQQAQVCP